MTDLEVLGITECSNNLFPTELTDEIPKEIDLHYECAKLNSKHKLSKINKNLNDNIKLPCVFAIIRYNPRDTSNLGCGYTQHIFITAKSVNDINLYALQRFGKPKNILLQWGSVILESYKVNYVTQTYYLDELNRRNAEIFNYNNLENVVDDFGCYKTYKYYGGPYHVKNGVIVSENNGKIMTMYKPNNIEEISL